MRACCDCQYHILRDYCWLTWWLQYAGAASQRRTHCVSLDSLIIIYAYASLARITGISSLSILFTALRCWPKRSGLRIIIIRAIARYNFVFKASRRRRRRFVLLSWKYIACAQCRRRSRAGLPDFAISLPGSRNTLILSRASATQCLVVLYRRRRNTEQTRYCAEFMHHSVSQQFDLYRREHFGLHHIGFERGNDF